MRTGIFVLCLIPKASDSVFSCLYTVSSPGRVPKRAAPGGLRMASRPFRQPLFRNYQVCLPSFPILPLAGCA